MYYSCSYCLFEKGNEDQRNQIQNIIKTTLYLLMTSTINMQKLMQTEQRKIKVSLNKVRKKLIKVRIWGFIKTLCIFVTIHVEEASNEQKTTYYNMNSHDVDKAKQARQEVYYEFSPVCRPSGTAIPVTEFKNYVESKKGNQEFFAEQFKV